jgi:hypothetical protein
MSNANPSTPGFCDLKLPDTLLAATDFVAR